MGLTGTISPLVGNLTQMDYFRIRGNSFSGTVPTELGLCTDLREVWLHFNEFEEAMPDEVCDLRGPRLDLIVGDCLPSGLGTIDFECECCTGCCDRSSVICDFDWS